MADLFDQESPESLGWKVPEPKPRKSILGGYSGRLSRGRLTQDDLRAIWDASTPVELSTPAESPHDRTALAVANDWAIEAANAAVGGAKTISDMISPGNPVSAAMDDFIKMGESRQSDVTKAAKAKLAAEIEAAGGFTDEM